MTVKPDYSVDIEPLEKAGITDDVQIYSILSAVTKSPISTKDAKRYFRETDLWQRNSPTEYLGKLEVARNDPAQNPQGVRDLLAELWAAIYDEAADTCGTTLPDQAALVKGVVDHLVATNQITREDCDGFYALGGGLKFPDGVSQEDLDASRLKHSQITSAAIKRQAGTDYISSLGKLFENAKEAGLTAHRGNETTYQDTESTVDAGVASIRSAVIDFITENA